MSCRIRSLPSRESHPVERAGQGIRVGEKQSTPAASEQEDTLWAQGSVCKVTFELVGQAEGRG